MSETVQGEMREKASWVAGIDIGGTKILMLLCTRNGDGQVYECRLPTQAADQPESFFAGCLPN